MEEGNETIILKYYVVTDFEAAQSTELSSAVFPSPLGALVAEIPFSFVRGWVTGRGLKYGASHFTPEPQ